MKISLKRFSHQNNINVAFQCPHCSHKGTFKTLNIQDIGSSLPNGQLEYFMGLRRCPNEECDGYLFFIADKQAKILLTAPNQLITFERSNIPEKVIEAFEEAIKCHSNSCFVASAIMIRKTLEEISIDRGAKGDNLKKKINDLGSKILVPKELLEGMDELRLLGNDAAHIESQTFNEIGKSEIEISIEFTKEILKAVYQYENLLQKLRSLKVR